MHLPSTDSPFPSELWLDIFALAIDVPYAFNTTWNYPPDDVIWDGSKSLTETSAESLQTRKSIALVCRKWNQLGSRFLYEELRLDKRAQIISLATLFQQKPQLGLKDGGDAEPDISYHGYGRWVKRIIINNGSLLQENTFPDIERLLVQCVNLQTILIEARGDAIRGSQVSKLFQLPFAPSLRRISLWNMEAQDNPYPLFNPSDLPLPLDWMALPSHWMKESFHPMANPKILLSNLSILEVFIQNNSDLRDFPVWELPALRYLYLNGLYERHISSLLPFFAMNGHRLLGLSLFTGHRCASLHQLLEHTPSLQQLVLDDIDLDSLRPPGSPAYPSITHVGLSNADYNSPKDVQRIERGLAYIAASNLLPALRTFRMLSDHIPDTLGDHWNSPIAIAAQHGIRLEDYKRRLLSSRCAEQQQTE